MQLQIPEASSDLLKQNKTKKNGSRTTKKAQKVI